MGRTAVGIGVHEEEVVVVAVQLIWGAATDTGLVRTLNEDSMVVSPPLFVVSDGMGGHAAGDRASAIVAEEFSGLIPESPSSIGAGWVRQRVIAASGRIRQGEGGGATVAGIAATQQDGRPYWLAFNIGDSRVYRSCAGSVEQISVDHSYVQELVDSGRLDRAAARRHPRRNVITRAVGMVGDEDIDCWMLPAESGDRLLICSDGISGELTDLEIAAILSANTDPQDAATALIRAALSAGGRDNATAVVVDVLSVAGRTDRITGGHAENTLEKTPSTASTDSEATWPRETWELLQENESDDDHLETSATGGPRR